MLWIGLTGGIATGKSTVSRILSERGYPVVDADVLAREVVLPGSDALKEIETVFGTKVISATGELDRKQLGLIVFSDPLKRQQLEEIVHPRVRVLAEEKKNKLAASGCRIAFYDVPLLFEKNMAGFFDRTLVVACCPSLQLERLQRRDRLSVDEAAKRLATQIPIDEKIRLAHEVIRNDGTLEELEAAVDQYLLKIN